MEKSGHNDRRLHRRMNIAVIRICSGIIKSERITRSFLKRATRKQCTLGNGTLGIIDDLVVNCVLVYPCYRRSLRDSDTIRRKCKVLDCNSRTCSELYRGRSGCCGYCRHGTGASAQGDGGSKDEDQDYPVDWFWCASHSNHFDTCSCRRRIKGLRYSANRG